MTRTITVSMACVLTAFLVVESCFAEESATDQVFNFVVTNRSAQDILLIGPENEDTRIGVLGKTFYPASTSTTERAQWPIGKWTTTTCPPYDPTRVQWRYTLVLIDDGTVTFEEQEYTIEYAADLRTVVRNWTVTRVLSLTGTWKSAGDKRGEIHFVRRKEEKPGAEAMMPSQSPDRGVQGGLSPAVAADGISDGEYRINMLLSNDHILGQVLTLTNCIVTTPAASGDLRVMRFEIRVREQGSFNTSGEDDQIVHGIVWCGKLKFAIPIAHVTDVSVYSFEAQYPRTNGVFEGTADVPNPDGGRMKKTFWMQRIPANKRSDCTR